jgi:uncharacterized membrane protein
MKKNILLGILVFAFIIEIALTVLCFFTPTTALKLFGMEYNSQTAFLGYIIAWFCLLVTVIIAYSYSLLRKNDLVASTLIYILGFWWIGLGIGVWVSFGKIDNLLLDSLKGLSLVLVNYFHQKEKTLIVSS